MTKPLPKSANSHVNPKRARRNLEDAFPEHWKLEPVRDENSNMEYGDDWIVKVTTDTNELSGAAFYIQSKVKEQRGAVGRRIGVKMKPSTLNYLFALPLPVLLHCYNPLSEVGYWMWFSDYCVQVGKTVWTGTKDVTVYIPTRNVLNAEGVALIQQHIAIMHHRHMLEKNAQISSRIDPNFGYEFKVSDNAASVAIYPKHPKAIEEHPINVSFDLDTDAQQAFQNALETGNPFRFNSHVTFHGVPNWLLPEVEPPFEMEVVLQPLVPQREVHWRIKCLDASEKELFKINRVMMRMTKQGTKYQVWEGNVPNHPLVCKFVVNKAISSTEFSFQYDYNNRSASALDWYFNLLDTLQNMSTIAISNLDVDMPPFVLPSVDPQPESLPDTKLRNFVSALAKISKALHITIPVPDKCKNSDLAMASSIIELLETGITSKLTIVPQELRVENNNLVVLTAILRRDVDRVFSDIEDQGYVEVSVPVSDKLLLLGQDLQIGRMQYVCHCTEIVNRDEVNQALEESSVTDDTRIINFVFSFDIAKSYIQLVEPNFTTN